MKILVNGVAGRGDEGGQVPGRPASLRARCARRGRHPPRPTSRRRRGPLGIRRGTRAFRAAHSSEEGSRGSK